MDTLVQLLTALNTLTPLGLAALLGLAIFIIFWKNPFKPLENKLTEVTDNHLHTVVDQLEKMNETLQRIEVKMGEEFAYLKARMNGGKH